MQNRKQIKEIIKEKFPDMKVIHDAFANWFLMIDLKILIFLIFFFVIFSERDLLLIHNTHAILIFVYFDLGLEYFCMMWDQKISCKTKQSSEKERNQKLLMTA